LAALRLILAPFPSSASRCFKGNGDTQGICGVTQQGVETPGAVEELSAQEGHETLPSGHYPKGLEIHDDTHRRTPLNQCLDHPSYAL